MNILSQSLWRDEAFSALMIKNSPQDIIRLTSGDATPPLHYLLLSLWANLFGDSEIALRLMGIVIFLAIAATMYLIGQKLRPGTGLWLGALTLTQPFLFNYAFEVRAYGLLALLSALVIYFYLTKRYLPMALAAVALLYTHLFGIWVVLILLGWMIYRGESPLWMSLPIVLYLPWIPSYLNFAKVAGNFLNPPDWRDLLDKFIKLGLPALGLVIPYFKKVSTHPQFILALALALGPLIGTFLVSQIRPTFIDRYLVTSVIGGLLILGVALAQPSFRKLAYLLIGIQLFLSANLFSQPTKPPFRELAESVKVEARAGDVVLNGSSLTYFESQYYGLRGKIYSPKNDVPYYVGRVLIPDEDIITAVPKAGRYWLINLDEGGGTLSEEFPGELISERVFGRLKLSLYEARQP